MTVTIHGGDARAVLALLPAGSVQCCVTSPPYYGLRDYGVDGQIGLEPTPDEYVAEMVAVFREVRRVLRDDGTLWLNIGDGYTSGNRGRRAPDKKNPARAMSVRPDTPEELKPKDLQGIPWRLAFALRADGWYLRSDIIWHKPNPMPESVRDRPTSAHEHVFLLSKRDLYFYDADAIREAPSAALIEQVNAGYGGKDTKEYAAAGAQSASGTKSRIIENARAKIDKQRGHGRRHAGFNDRWDAMSRDEQMAIGSNARNVWTIAPKPFKGAHFATMPTTLAERCILAGTKPGDTVLDPFGGAGTTGLVADRLNRNAVLIELNPDYITLANQRIADDRAKRGTKPLDSRQEAVVTCYNDQPAGVAMPTLITFATDNPDDAKRMFEALYGAPAQENLPLPAAPPAARGRAAAKAPDPASTVTTTVAPPAAPAAPVPTPPAAVVPPPTPTSPPPAAPAAPAVQAQPEPEPGWTLEHVKGMAKAFLTNPKGGPDKLEEVLKRHGAEAVGTASPGVWHLLYADMAAILEAA